MRPSAGHRGDLDGCPDGGSDASSPPAGSAGSDLEVTLELVTPAFLAGANQDQENCDLRPATLRGQLRWWWRNAPCGPSARLDELRALEAALGATPPKAGRSGPAWFPSAGMAPNCTISRTASIPGPTSNVSMAWPIGRTTRQPRACSTPPTAWTRAAVTAHPGGRYFLDAGSSWAFRLVARPARYFARRSDARLPRERARAESVAAGQVLAQARATLWLLTTFGGVGSKARKGFGSLQVEGEGFERIDLGHCRTIAAICEAGWAWTARSTSS